MVTVERVRSDRWVGRIQPRTVKVGRRGSLDGPVRVAGTITEPSPVAPGWWRRPQDALRCCLQDPLVAGVKRAEPGCLVTAECRASGITGTSRTPGRLHVIAEPI